MAAYAHPLASQTGGQTYIVVESPSTIFSGGPDLSDVPADLQDDVADLWTKLKAAAEDNYAHRDVEVVNDASNLDFIKRTGITCFAEMFRDLRGLAGMGTRVDTVVVIGHGNMGEMGVGSGKLPYPTKPEEELTDVQRHVRRILQPGQRSISVHNRDTWLQEFTNQAAYFCADAFDCFHVFLLGCSTAEQDDFGGAIGVKSLCDVVADALQAEFGCTVCVYGLSNEMDASETKAILDGLPAIKRIAALSGKTSFRVRKGSGKKLTDAEKEASLHLVCSRRLQAAGAAAGQLIPTGDKRAKKFGKEVKAWNARAT